MKKENNIENSIFYKNNMKIQKNMWKVFTLTLIASLFVIIIKGLS
jgi:hypothetical protein